MVIKLYGYYKSHYVRLVAAILLEKQVPFEQVFVSFKPPEPEYLAKNPFGQMPCIDDDGFILYESRAICHYIASKYSNQGKPLLPTELKANALYHQAASVEAFRFYDHATQITRELSKERQGLTPDRDVVEKYTTKLNAVLDVYDSTLSKQKYLVGNDITLVDFYHLPAARSLENLGLSIIESKPNVARWYKEISTRDSWVSTELKT